MNPAGTDLLYTLSVNSQTPGAGHGIALDGRGDVYFTAAMNAPAELHIAKTAARAAAVSDLADDWRSGKPILGRPAPNPSANGSRITYTLPGDATGTVQLRVLDLSGRVVRTLESGARTAGIHAVSWDGTDRAGEAVGAGVYFYELRWNGERRSQRVLLVR